MSCTAFLQRPGTSIHPFIYPRFSFLAIYMRHHPHPSALPTDILLEKVPPLYGGNRATLSLNIVIVGAGLGGLDATHAFARARRSPHHAARVRLRPRCRRCRHPSLPQRDADPTSLRARSGPCSSRRGAHSDRVPLVQ